ncbi:multicopper oxidase family protein [Glaciibacter psychrotolerans]|uniref:FtsP/CotA-like multicopper oxidase with cupredoxin domain n=1 Tax=Glaciibacter psychrotolerans TaxID=670054 RepID=A0A7Z0EC72_9MICO|nr:multicopper oxidase family protein [Leifsonia psychrotolerans]NYJ18924.1 FtsP/CotA-like multicopper oxidase with cupredoxin domain [Leifsonia psychrotolerans]
MQPISRRHVLVLGGIGAAGVFIGGTGLFVGYQSGPVPTNALAPTGSTLAEPKILSSSNGVLAVRLNAAEGPARTAGRDASVLSYNGGVPGPTLFVRPGDLLQVTVENRLSTTTNLHVHGLHVSPEGNSDNVFVAIEPGDSFDYAYRLPENHPPGVYWYHPHHHGMVAAQVFGGLYGAIVVEDTTPIPVTRERVLVISDITLDAEGHIPESSPMDQMMGREGAMVLINGQTSPQLSAAPSERERWRIVNACASRYLKLRLDGQTLQLLGMDSGRFETPRDIEELLLPPGNRADLLVTMAAGTSILRTLPVDRGGTGMMMGGGAASSDGADLLTLTVAGESADAAALEAVPRQLAPRDLRTETVTGRRELTFAMGMGRGMGGGMMSFTIDGKPFDAERVDTLVRAGAIEEWTLTNTSPMDHPIHLHVWPMQLMTPSADDAPLWQDVVNVPARSSVRVRIAFEGFTGTTVYHCHILDHEDLGMMGIIEVA